MGRLSVLFSILLLFPLITFAGSAPFELIDNRIITPIYLNGHGPYMMMFDTGATNILSTRVANELGLNLYGSFLIGGGGANPVQAAYCNAPTMTFAEQTMTNTRFICMDVDDMKKAIGFPELDGLIGYEIFSQYQVEFDFENRQTHLSSLGSPNRIAQRADAVTIPFQFYGTTPLIDIYLDGVFGQFLLDTGDRASMTLNLPFIKNNFLIQKYAPAFSTMTGYGIGGALSTGVAFANQVQLNGISFGNVLIRIPVMNSVALSDPNNSGTIGMGLFRQYNMNINYARRELTVSKNSVFDQDRAFDRSGMWIGARNNDILIMDVLEGGPAWRSGLQKSQTVVAINGVPASQINLVNLRDALKNPTTKQVTLTIQTPAGTRDVVVILKDIIIAP